MITKVGLFFGVDDYDLEGADLQGCIHDVSSNLDFFDKKGFTTSFLYNKAATRENILALLNTIVENKPDRLVLNYSGHGSYIIDENGDEEDGQDEIVCCSNFDYDGNGFIIDDEFNAILSNLPEETRTLAIFDCCHSGTQLRDIKPIKTKGRFLPPQNKKNIVGKTTVREVVSSFKNTICYSACKDTETAAEIMNSNGEYCGAFSQALIDVLSKNINLTFSEIQKEVEKKLKSYGASQTPVLTVSDESLLNEKLTWILEDTKSDMVN